MKKIRLLLLPLSWIYGSILWMRNRAYNAGIFKSNSPEIKTITIGNIALGGTGKTPHIEYILNLPLSRKAAVLSRGYGRSTKGTLRVLPGMDASETGDEPLQIARKFSNTPVVVDENRRRGINYIRKEFPEVGLILLDDALQHRQIEAGMNILLTTFDHPFYSDHYLPAGNLRDHKIRAKDADIILVTKSPDTIKPDKKLKIKSKLGGYTKAVFFDSIQYKHIHPLFSDTSRAIESFKKVFLVSGIAKPEYFVNTAATVFEIAEHFNYPDHHRFGEADLIRFRKFIGSFAPGEIALLTTEKDAMRLKEIIHSEDRNQLPAFYWEIGIDAGDDKTKLDNLILAYANQP